MFDPDEVPEVAALTPIADRRGPASAGPEMPAGVGVRGSDLLPAKLPMYIRLEPAGGRWLRLDTSAGSTLVRAEAGLIQELSPPGQHQQLPVSGRGSVTGGSGGRVTGGTGVDVGPKPEPSADSNVMHEVLGFTSALAT